MTYLLNRDKTKEKIEKKKTIIRCGGTANLALTVFFIFSGDGVIKIWDRDKTLLREIMMNDTLTVASFLNTRGTVVTINSENRFLIDSYGSSLIFSLLLSGDILIGFKQHIFIIPREKGK